MKKTCLFLLFGILLLTGGCSNGTSEPPEAVVKIDDKKIKVVKGTYEWETRYLTGKSTTIADASSPFQIAQELTAKKVRSGAKMTISFNDRTKPELEAYVWDRGKRKGTITFEENKLIVPSEKGTYIIEMNAKWKNGECSYTFVIEVE